MGVHEPVVPVLLDEVEAGSQTPEFVGVLKSQ
jgi:hypothetical protein